MGTPRPKSAGGARASRRAGQLRIVGGAWRSRRIGFAAAAGVRPTSDRIRETLFNWLRDVVPGARCLDLYAGSGALGFEALSRGAERVTFVDQDLRVIQQLQASAQALGAQDAEIVWMEAMEYLAGCPSGPFDVVFLDPPFRDDVLGECCRRLEHFHLLAPAAWIYLETQRQRPLPVLPRNWRMIHQTATAQVACGLARRAQAA